VKKNAQISLAVVGVVTLFSSAQSAADLISKQTTPAAQMGVAKPDFSQMRRSRSGLNYERGAFHLD